MQIAIHALSGVAMFHLAVPMTVFSAVARLGLADWSTGLFTTDSALVHTVEGYTVSGLGGPGLAATADVVVVPAWLPGEDPAGNSLIPVLQEAHARGATVVGLCLGALPVIEAGLLEGRTAVGHWQALRQVGRLARGRSTHTRSHAHETRAHEAGPGPTAPQLKEGLTSSPAMTTMIRRTSPDLGEARPEGAGNHDRGGAAHSPQQGETRRASPGSLGNLDARTNPGSPGSLGSAALYVDHGDVLTSAGAASGLDACLHLVRERLGAAPAQEVSRYLLAAPQRDGGQPQYVVRPVPGTGQDDLGTAVSWTMSWAQHHLAEPLPLTRLAQVAQMSTRSLVRVFRDATGTTPAAWVRAQRVDAARHLLETTTLPVERVARACGFTSPVTLRQALRAATGQTPSAYRLRHQQRPEAGEVGEAGATEAGTPSTITPSTGTPSTSATTGPALPGS